MHSVAMALTIICLVVVVIINFFTFWLSKESLNSDLDDEEVIEGMNTVYFVAYLITLTAVYLTTAMWIIAWLMG